MLREFLSEVRGQWTKRGVGLGDLRRTRQLAESGSVSRRQSDERKRSEASSDSRGDVGMSSDASNQDSDSDAAFAPEDDMNDSDFESVRSILSPVFK